jgi:hypothetical protein
MSRIRRGYEARFRALLRELQARRLEQGGQWLVARAEKLRRQQAVSDADALAQVHDSLFRKIQRHLARHAGTSASASGALAKNPNAPPVLLCDAGLGGLARWLRAAGHEALWKPKVDDDELLKQARDLSATLLTTDSMLMERRLLRDGIIPSVWLPPTQTTAAQLALVFRELGLHAREPRCMSCGGQLRRVEKETMRERIPPKTWRWKDEYFVCSRCDKLFWHGTHWQRIAKQLERLGGPAQCES